MNITPLAQRARTAAGTLALTTRAGKDAGLHAMAGALLARTDELLAGNQQDLAAAEQAGMPSSTRDRLALSRSRIEDVAGGLRHLATLPDPVGEVVRGSTLANGMQLHEVRVPFGVIGIIYEGRPNVTVDAAGICLKAGNAVLLRGSSSASRSNAALVTVLRDGLVEAGLPADAVQLLDASSRDSAKQLMRARGLVDVLIPRGGAALIQSVVQDSTVPVIETGTGNCHVYVDAHADLEMALAILLNAKTQRPSVCNAAESLLVHEAVAAEFLPRALAALAEAGVTVHGDERVRQYDRRVLPATEEDFGTEYLSLSLSAAVVDSLAAAVGHIAWYGSGHSEAIVTDSAAAAREFTARVDSAAVLVNASTRFTDGGEFGFGAEIGISTQKLHARGPMGLPELTSTKFVVTGAGHTR